MAALDLLGRRWALRILFELHAGPLGARQLRATCDGMSSSVLYVRLGELSEARLVAKNAEGLYELTEVGVQLREAFSPLTTWAEGWAAGLDELSG